MMPSIRILPNIASIGRRAPGGLAGAAPNPADPSNPTPIAFPAFKRGWIDARDNDGNLIIDDEDGQPYQAWGKIKVLKNFWEEVTHGTKEQWEAGEVEITTAVAQKLVALGWAEEVL